MEDLTFKTKKMSFNLTYDEEFRKMFYEFKNKITKEGDYDNNVLTKTMIECMENDGIEGILEQLPNVRKKNKGELHKTQTIVINLSDVKKNNQKLYNNIGKVILLASNKDTLNYTRDYVYKCILKYGVKRTHDKFSEELKALLSKRTTDIFEKYKLE